jgi:SAM-dependent methyltransferase
MSRIHATAGNPGALRSRASRHSGPKPESPRDYLLAPIANERERLRIQAEAWAPAADRLFTALGSMIGSTCLDLGCGAPGVLDLLARHAGPSGRVVGLDRDELLVADARRWAARPSAGAARIDIVAGDAFATGFPDASFDLVHARFMFAPLGRAEALLAEMHRLLRPGGLIVIEEPDAAAWTCWPPSAAFSSLVAAIVAAFADSGGDFNAGQNVHARLVQAGYCDIGWRADVLSLPGSHAYAQLPLLFARSLQTKLEARLGNAAVEALESGCRAALSHPDARVTSFVLQQTWARKR